MIYGRRARPGYTIVDRMSGHTEHVPPISLTPAATRAGRVAHEQAHALVCLATVLALTAALATALMSTR